MAIRTESALYQRLGGRQMVTDIVRDLYGRLVSDHRTWYYWKGSDVERRAAEERLFTDRVCFCIGEPIGDASHNSTPSDQRLTIGKTAWGAFVGLAGETLLSSALEGAEKEELFSALTRCKAYSGAIEQEPPTTVGFAGYALGLTGREKEVLRLVAMGKNNAAIAQELYISINTVTRHVTNIFIKTDSRNRVEAAVYAVRHGIL